MKLMLLFLMLSTNVLAEETMSEKAQALANDVARGLKKGVNRLSEILCFEGDAKCLAKKIKNRAEEAKDLAVDTAVELKNKVN